jgi:hypothetical protein
LIFELGGAKQSETASKLKQAFKDVSAKDENQKNAEILD